jgi:hypothetical protein
MIYSDKMITVEEEWFNVGDALFIIFIIYIFLLCNLKM